MPTDRHQVIVRHLFLTRFPRATDLGGTVLFAPLRLRIRAGKFREPDLVVLLDAGDPRRGNDFWTGADLVVEVVSPDDPDRDLRHKHADYAEARIPEYWIVNPIDETVTMARAGRGQLRRPWRFPPWPARPLRMPSRLFARRDERLRSTLTVLGLDPEPPADRRRRTRDRRAPWDAAVGLTAAPERASLILSDLLRTGMLRECARLGAPVPGSVPHSSLDRPPGRRPGAGVARQRAGRDSPRTGCRRLMCLQGLRVRPPSRAGPRTFLPDQGSGLLLR